MKKCTNLGCLKDYSEQDNTNGSCVYHDGKPIFHDIKKGWTCCNQIVYDWDEFTKLKGCRVGAHTDIKKDVSFFKSSSNIKEDTTQTSIVKEEVKPIIKDINEYEKEQKRIAEEKERNTIKNKVPIKNSEGKYYCTNAGCKDKVYFDIDNADEACSYHIGKPIFHDLKKYWSCCKTETWDWDEFLKIPTCAKGRHNPKV